MTSDHEHEGEKTGGATVELFSGFAAPTSNTTYTPNQFFDVCLPHRSRGCVRIVAYMIRKTLGWSDEHGNPVCERFTFTYDDFIQGAGVSRDMVKAAIDEAIAFGFIQCLRTPVANRTGVRAVSGLYELRWDEGDQGNEYVKDPAKFRGFFADDGNRSYIPNQFFDVVVRRETLMVAKIVGSVARFSIGFTTKWGHRRQHASMSLTDIQRYARIGNRTKLTQSIRVALDHHYIQQFEAGYFDKAGGMASRSAVYGLRWLNPNADGGDSQKMIPDVSGPDRRSEKVTGNGQKKIPAERSERDTGIQITTTNKTLKQQPTAAAGMTARGDAESVAACFSTLKAEGFDDRTARRFAKAYPIGQVLNQIEWLPMRGLARNRVGLLRRAIEQNWPKPVSHTGRSTVDRTGTDRITDDTIEQARRQLAYQLTLKQR
jgi:hypothetical protein